ncbi:hypothetical protein [Sphingomonas colocasiae]|uniref:DUF1254 domain-containing protein n=1 Tax=Sphingomonas colocasiae TaxID=1848973 RepID=A0ABS7PMX9_9SPHN|nr:hypothetical protein [Sphingomonas colocasiae]MBY8822349.1 hypothetical protein [Sphingomonas colocasiae]
MLRTVLICVSALALSTIGVQAQQGPQEIRLSAKKAFKHKHSGLEVPPMLDGIARSNITALEDDQLDTFIRFDRPDASEGITVYIYREVGNALPVWFDRARWAIETRAQLYGTPRRINEKLTFTPPGRSGDAGMIAIYMPSTGAYQSTGVALVPMGEWLVKIRYSSGTIAPDALAERIRGVLAALRWPGKLDDAPPAIPVEPCATSLPAQARSHPAPGDGASNLAGAMMSLPSLTGQFRAKGAPPPRWCRDDGVEPKGNVYRPDDASDRYLIALSDAGRGISVRPDGFAGLIEPDAKPSWRIEMLDLSRITAFASQDRLPPPSQAIEIVRSGDYVTRTSTWGKKSNIEVNADALK